MEDLCNPWPILVITLFSALSDVLLSTRVEILYRQSQAYHIQLIYSCLWILCYYGEPTMVDRLDRRRFFFSMKMTTKTRQSPEELSLNQNPMQMLCCLLGYSFLKGRHSSSRDRVDCKVPSLAGSRQPFAKAAVHRSRFYTLLQVFL